MRKFNNTVEIVSFTFQVVLTTMFVSGFVALVVALITGNISEASFGMLE